MRESMPSNDSSLPLRAPVQALAFSELEHSPSPDAQRVFAPSVNPLHMVKAKLTVCVGTVELTIGELLKAREHQVVRLNQTIDQPVDIVLEGQVIARGILVAVDDHFGVKITELPLPLKH